MRSLAQQAAEEGSIDATEHRYIDNIFNFGNQKVRDIMTPRGNIDFLHVKEPVDSMLESMRNSHHTRLPVYNRTRDDIVGILHYRDLLRTDINSLKGPNKDITSMLRRPVMVTENRLVMDLFNTFCQRKLSIALVVDEYGSVTGLITMDNMLKSIFGEIGPIQHIQRPSKEAAGILEETEPGVYYIDAGVPLRIFNESLSAALESEHGSSTISGLLLEKHGELPLQGEHVIVDGWRFDIEKVARNRITLTKVFKLKPEDMPVEEEVSEEEEEEAPIPHHH